MNPIQTTLRLTCPSSGLLAETLSRLNLVDVPIDEKLQRRFALLMTRTPALYTLHSAYCSDSQRSTRAQAGTLFLATMADDAETRHCLWSAGAGSRDLAVTLGDNGRQLLLTYLSVWAREVCQELTRRETTSGTYTVFCRNWRVYGGAIEAVQVRRDGVSVISVTVLADGKTATRLALDDPDTPALRDSTRWLPSDVTEEAPPAPSDAT